MTSIMSRMRGWWRSRSIRRLEYRKPLCLFAIAAKTRFVAKSVVLGKEKALLSLVFAPVSQYMV